MFRASLQKILDGCDGAIAGLVMGFDGIAVEKVGKSAEAFGGQFDAEAVSMEFSFVLDQVRKAAEVLEVGALDEVAIRSESLTFLVRVLSDEYFLAMALLPDANFGKGRFMMRLALPELREQLDL